MRAVVLGESPWSLRLDEDWPDPKPGFGEVLIRVSGVGICGSDLALVAGYRRPEGFPWVLGHEAFGEIVDTGGDIDATRIGQRVVIEPNFPCLSCPSCRRGFTSACTRRVSLGFSAPGALADLVVVPSEFAWEIPADWSDEDAVCTEPLTVALTAMRRAGLRPRDGQVPEAAEGRCLVLGAGSQGALLCAALVAGGITPFVLEPHDGRRALAASLGAVAAGPSDDEFSLIFETSGATAALAEATSRAAAGATIVLVGLSGGPIALDADTVVRQQLRMQGSLIYEHPKDFAGTLSSSAIPAIRPGRVLHGYYPLNEAVTAFRRARQAPGKTWIRVEP